jgi:hypothetical protein
MDYSDFFLDNKRNGYKTREKYLQEHFNEIYRMVIKHAETYNLNNLPFKEKIWHFINDSRSPKVCEECGVLLKFKRSLLEGYGKYCSLTCCNKHEGHIKSTMASKKIWRANLSDEEREEQVQKVKQGVLKKYGVDNYSNFKEFRSSETAANTNKFIKLSKDRYKNYYDYSMVEYRDINSEVKIICPIHGIFKTTPKLHLHHGVGCKKCSCRMDTDKFILKCTQIHDGKYDYSKVNYITNTTPIHIICPVHGDFKQKPHKHLLGHGCRKCGNARHLSENSLKEFIRSLNIDFLENTRALIRKREIDIYIPSHNLAIEFNGLYWHNELFVDSNYHLEKTSMCEEKGIRLIHVFEDEWMFKKEVVKSRIRNILGISGDRIYARKCEIKEIKAKDARIFLDQNHLQGYSVSSCNVGLFYKDELVSLMAFVKPRLGIGNNKSEYIELSRFANKLDTIVVGGASKLLKYYVRTYEPSKIISYADIRWSRGELYEQLGFIKTHTNKPNYWYVINAERKHRFLFRKSKLKKDGFDIENKTEHQIMLDRKIYRIYDCGTIHFELII